MPVPSGDLTDAIQRHEKGERSPWVLGVLNHAAWEAFHAPWEKPPSLATWCSPTFRRGYLPFTPEEPGPPEDLHPLLRSLLHHFSPIKMYTENRLGFTGTLDVQSQDLIWVRVRETPEGTKLKVLTRADAQDPCMAEFCSQWNQRQDLLIKADHKEIESSRGNTFARVHLRGDLLITHPSRAIELDAFAICIKEEIQRFKAESRHGRV